MPLREQYVFGLDVAVEDAHPVRVRQGVSHRRRDRQRVGDAQASPARQLLAQRATLDVRHDVIEKAGRLAGVVQREDVRVGEPGRDLDFLEEALDAEEGSEARQQNLEGHFAAMFAVVREIHRRHASPAEHAAQLVPLREGGLEIAGEVGRHEAGI